VDPGTLDIVAGCTILTVAMGTLTYLVLWSRRTIERIARRGYGSARRIVKELNGDK
jgi:hypothetical protein